MSATNRGSKRRKGDCYYTPEDVVTNFLNHYSIGEDSVGLNIFEPSAGGGVFLRAIRQQYPKAYLMANDISEDNRKLLNTLANYVSHLDFVNCDTKHFWMNYDVIISNSPFGISLPYIERCFEIAETQHQNVKIIMLLRTAFMESKARYDFWQKHQHQLTGLYTLSKRPSFTDDGKTDNCCYSWMIWETKGNGTQTIKII